MYKKVVKRILDIMLAMLAVIILSPVYLIIALLVRIKLGSPIIFKQKRPGKDEKIFCLYKFRTMTDECDENGELLPDEVRLTKFGKALRSTSLDELPELFNIIKGEMSFIGPRPLLVRDMVFMTAEQRKRHTVMPGLSGWSQINGRNSIDWVRKLDYDLEYIQKITFLGDLKILFKTIPVAFIDQEGITYEDMATAEDFGDYLLRLGKVDKQTYDEKQEEAKKLLMM